MYHHLLHLVLLHPRHQLRVRRETRKDLLLLLLLKLL
jgi:hypothetical protein